MLFSLSKFYLKTMWKVTEGKQIFLLWTMHFKSKIDFKIEVHIFPFIIENYLKNGVRGASCITLNGSIWLTTPPSQKRKLN